ncbi:MAG TPA: RsmB/NOP family class I SAM-dependent RNA methyltransferase [Rhizomicrobium sp.]|jgi:16S rRNA (cytosine967-C5)-methyltransferase|nr:RsmB/NOP family class I SAM-dependent RNA methyltransferase [Rhizomicrobium sp.]
MTPAARLQHVIDILAALGATEQPADRLLKDWFRTRRYAGSKDRAAIAERVFGIQRHRASLAWRLQDDSPRALAIASLLAEGADPAALFTADGYGPPALTDAERAAIAATPPAAPAHVVGEYPQFLGPELAGAFGGDLAAEMAALQTRAPVDLRVNTLRRERGEVLAALIAQGFAATPTPHAPHGIRIASGEGSAALGRGPMFESGAYEFQDEAAQIAAILCRARQGSRILDYAAGAGGKSLALAAEMRNQGEIVACDIRQPALQELAARARRAGATNIKTHLLNAEAPPAGTFDTVLLDAPCSGSGTWRRQPELRWRTTPQRLAELVPLQDRLLAQAAAQVKPGGRLVYATCSVLPRENAARIAAFLDRNPAFRPLRADAAWRESVAGEPPPGMGEVFRASPYTTGTDGFFAAVLQRE